MVIKLRPKFRRLVWADLAQLRRHVGKILQHCFLSCDAFFTDFLS